VINQGETPHDQTQLVHRDLLQVSSDVLTDTGIICVCCLHEAEAREEQEVVLGQELEAVGAEKSDKG
jgi:hypothetical protein